MFQAYKSFRPISNEKQWLPYTGNTTDEVRKLVRDNEMIWDGIYIAPVESEQK